MSRRKVPYGEPREAAASRRSRVGRGGRRFHLRGEDGARGEWRLLAACHNLRKIFRHAGTAGLAALAG